MKQLEHTKQAVHDGGASPGSCPRPVLCAVRAVTQHGHRQGNSPFPAHREPPLPRTCGAGQNGPGAAGQQHGGAARSRPFRGSGAMEAAGGEEEQEEVAEALRLLRIEPSAAGEPRAGRAGGAAGPCSVRAAALGNGAR